LRSSVSLRPSMLSSRVAMVKGEGKRKIRKLQNWHYARSVWRFKRRIKGSTYHILVSTIGRPAPSASAAHPGLPNQRGRVAKELPTARFSNVIRADSVYQAAAMDST
jgi:hypothetical protein